MAQEGQKAARRACRRGTTADSCCTDEATQARERGVNKGKEQEENTKAKRSKAKNKIITPEATIIVAYTPRLSVTKLSRRPCHTICRVVPTLDVRVTSLSAAALSPPLPRAQINRNKPKQ